MNKLITRCFIKDLFTQGNYQNIHHANILYFMLFTIRYYISEITTSNNFLVITSNCHTRPFTFTKTGILFPQAIIFKHNITVRFRKE